LLYLGIQNVSRKWAITLSQLAIFFDGRLENNLNPLRRILSRSDLLTESLTIPITTFNTVRAYPGFPNSISFSNEWHQAILLIRPAGYHEVITVILKKLYTFTKAYMAGLFVTASVHSYLLSGDLPSNQRERK